MKKVIFTIVMAIMCVAGATAQNAIEMAKEQQELNKIKRKILNAKPTKEAQKEAKKLEKKGWTVPAGERSIAQQITESHLFAAEYMSDENGAPTRRFIQHTVLATANTYSVAYAAARSNAQVEVASMIGTQVAAAMQGKLDNAQQDAENAVSVTKFNQRVKAIVHESLTNSIPVLACYRVLPNKNFEVQVRIAFDKKEVSARIKRALQNELELEGDQLNGLVDEAINNAVQ